MVRADPCHTSRNRSKKTHKQEQRGEGEGDPRDEEETEHVVPVEDVLNFVLLDTANCEYCVPVDKIAIEKLGVTVIDMPLVEDNYSNDNNNNANEYQSSNNVHHGKSKILNPKKVVEVLISLSS